MCANCITDYLRSGEARAMSFIFTKRRVVADMGKSPAISKSALIKEGKENRVGIGKRGNLGGTVTSLKGCEGPL